MDPAALVFFPLLAVLLITWGSWTIELAIAPRSRSLGRELARAAMLAVVPGLGTVWVAVSSRGLRELVPAGGGSLLVPWEAAIAASAATIVVLVALAVRLRGQPPADTDDDPLLASDHLFVPWSAGALILALTGALVLGLPTGWWLEGACLGIVLTVPVVLGQRLVYWLLDRRRRPPERRTLLLLTIGPVVALAVPLLAWTVYSVQPHVVLRERLGRPLPESATDVRFEERSFSFFESRWRCSFVLAPGDVASFATEAGFTRSGPDRYSRVFQSPMDGVGYDDELSIDPLTGRVHYQWHTGGGW